MKKTMIIFLMLMLYSINISASNVKFDMLNHQLDYACIERLADQSSAQTKIQEKLYLDIIQAIWDLDYKLQKFPRPKLEDVGPSVKTRCNHIFSKQISFIYSLYQTAIKKKMLESDFFKIVRKYDETY